MSSRGHNGLSWCHDRGQSVVEFALILPILLLVLFGIIEFSLVVYNQAMITNASREGARYGALFNANPSSSDPAERAYLQYNSTQVTNIVSSYLSNHLITFGSAANPTITFTPAPRGQTGVVTVNYTYRFLVLSNLLSLVGSKSAGASSINLSATATMRME